VNYSATNTPGVRFSFNSRNLLSGSADGWSTNSYFYNSANQLTNVVESQGSTTQQWTYSFDALSRVTGIAWRITGDTNVFTTRYVYDSLGRVTNITSDSGAFGYSYTNAGAQVSRLRYANGETATWLYDTLGRMTNLACSVGGAWSYSYDSRDQVVGRVDTTTNVYSYQYDDQGRLTEAGGLKGTNPVSGYPFRFGFDRVGNRVWQAEGDRQRTMTFNRDNQLTADERPKAARVGGSINERGVVEVKSNTATNWARAATRYASSTQVFYQADVTIANIGTNNLIYVRATDPSGNASTNTVRVDNTPTSRTFVYDADRNQLNLSATTTNSFDAENRLIRISYSDGYSLMKYDGCDRLREVSEYNAVGTLMSCVRYVWNGWMPWAELDQSNKVIRTLTFGVSLSGTVGGAAGIGGLLAIRQGGTNSHVRSDGKGNVTEVRTSNGVVVGAYSYSPFGKLLSQTNTYNQPFRFQTKLYHARSGLSYFGARWYDPSTGRWLSRDPLGEGSGINLYEYCSGSPLNYYDPLGLSGRLIIMSIRGDRNLLGSIPAGTHSLIAFIPDNASASTWSTWGRADIGKTGVRLNDLVDLNDLLNDAGPAKHAFISDQQEINMLLFIAQRRGMESDAWSTWSPCSDFASDLWHETTGERLQDRRLSGLGYSDPNVLADSIERANKRDKK
jgi:RHS repeat-associated protein